MDKRAAEKGASTPSKRLIPKELIPKEFLKVLAVWSLIPGYLVAGGFIGYMLDRWLKLFPYLTGAGFILALLMAVRDMLRLREIMWR